MGQFIYRGESPGKEAARSQGYARLPQWAFYRRTHIVVAGSCGDINYLLRQGVSPKNILACDISHRCVVEARKLGVRVHWGDIVGAVEEELKNSPIGSINVDLCRSLIHGAPVLKKVLDLQYPYGEPHIFFTFLCGHDPGLRKDKWEKNPGAERIAYFREIVKRPLTNYYIYQSWTQSSPGSPMCMAYL